MFSSSATVVRQLSAVRLVHIIDLTQHNPPYWSNPPPVTHHLITSTDQSAHVRDIRDHMAKGDSPN